MNRFALYPFLVKQWKYASLASLVVGAVIARHLTLRLWASMPRRFSHCTA